MTPDFLTLPDRRLAYQLRRGKAHRPGIIFLGGYASDMTGTKAQFLAARCEAADIGFLRFDYRGHGQSSGDFADGTLGAWAEDAGTVLDRLTEDPQIVVGSSMGGWIAFLLALGNPERVKALIGVAAAPDFTVEARRSLTPEQHAELEKTGKTHFPAPPPAEPLIVTKHLLDEASNHLLLHRPVPLICPVRLLQGMQDEEVPWETALRIARAVTTDDVRVMLVKDGGHRLSRPQDLELLWQTVEEFL